MKTSVTLLLFVASGVAGFFAWRAHLENRAVQSALLSLQQQRTISENRIHGATVRLTCAENSAAESRVRSAAVPAKPTTSTPPAQPRRDNPHLIDDSPELQNLQFAARRAQFAITYGPFYRTAALTSQQIQGFEQNLLRLEERQADIMATASTQHADLQDPAYQKLFADAHAEYQSAQRSLLGEVGAKQFADYERTAPTREIVSALAGATAMAGAPLDAAQAEQLTRVIAGATLVPLSGGFVSAPVDWNAVHEQAKTFLSAAQLTYIETTESSGPRGSGGRFMPAFHAAIDAAVKEDAAAPNPPASP